MNLVSENGNLSGGGLLESLSLNKKETEMGKEQVSRCTDIKALFWPPIDCILTVNRQIFCRPRCPSKYRPSKYRQRWPSLDDHGAYCFDAIFWRQKRPSFDCTLILPVLVGLNMDWLGEILLRQPIRFFWQKNWLVRIRMRNEVDPQKSILMIQQLKDHQIPAAASR